MSNYPHDKKHKRDKTGDSTISGSKSSSISVNSSSNQSAAPSTQSHSQLRDVRDASSHVGRSRHHHRRGSGASSTSVSSHSTATLTGHTSSPRSGTDIFTGNPLRGAQVRERFQSVTSTDSSGGVSLPSSPALSSSVVTPSRRSRSHSHSNTLAASSPLSSSMVSNTTIGSRADSSRTSVILDLENLSLRENLPEVPRPHHSRAEKERKKEPEIPAVARGVMKLSFGIVQSMGGPGIPKKVEDKLRKEKEKKERK